MASEALAPKSPLAPAADTPTAQTKRGPKLRKQTESATAKLKKTPAPKQSSTVSRPAPRVKPVTPRARKSATATTPPRSEAQPSGRGIEESETAPIASSFRLSAAAVPFISGGPAPPIVSSSFSLSAETAPFIPTFRLLAEVVPFVPGGLDAQLSLEMEIEAVRRERNRLSDFLERFGLIREEETRIARLALQGLLPNEESESN